MSLRLVNSANDQAVAFELCEKPLLGAERSVPVSEWLQKCGDSLLPAVGALLTMAEDEERAVKVGRDSIDIPHSDIAALDSATAGRIGLPPVTPHILDLQHAGILTDPGFHFVAQWRDASQRPVAGAKRVGAFLAVGSQRYRIPEPQFTIITATERFNAAASDLDGRLSYWAKLRPLLPADSQASIQASGYLRQTRIVHASRFSLVLKKAAGGITFDPILFGDNAPEFDDEPVHEIESVLPPVQQRVFAEKRFPASNEVRGQYTLEGGWYVTLSDDVRSALTVVRKVQQADETTRWAFARNPRSFLREALGPSIDEEQFSQLFVETFEYSERVQGAGLWEPSVLPWVKKDSEDWLPKEEFGIQVAGQNLRVKPEELSGLINRVNAAVQNGEPTLQFGSHTIPASQSTIDALGALTGLLKPDNVDVAKRPEPKAETPAGGRVVLMISTHHDEVVFERRITPRITRLADGVSTRVKTSLKPHQLEGVAWLQSAWRSGMPGVLLADDMGLGKTLQALALLAWRRDHIASTRHLPLLIVAPTALLKNWEKEADTHLTGPRLGELVRAYGADLKRLRESTGSELEVGRSLLDIQQIQAADWVLTTYETMRDYQHSFGSVYFDTIVLDEIQKIKTPGTLMTHAAKALNGDFVVGLSGTPVENRLADLWCVVDSTNPGYLGALKQFSETFESEIDAGKLRTLKASLTEPKPPAVAVMMRRMKEGNLPGLKKKIEHVLPEPMPPAQAQAYTDAVERARASDGKQAILQALQSIRSISLHHAHPDTANGADYPLQSARFRAALRVLDEIQDKGEKALVFLESRDMQAYLGLYLHKRYSLKHLPLQINGSVAGPERQARVDKFQSAGRGFDVMILSPRAGGVGLTLTSANHVIHLSRWWNPAVEDQCSDRAYRMGQNKDVHVYYPQAVHPEFGEASFDRTLHDLLTRKRRLCSDLLMPPAGTDSDLSELFSKSVGPVPPANASCKADDRLPDIDAMEPVEFEAWALGRLRDAGYRVFRTPWSHDAGADGIARKAGSRDIVIQCKHSQGRHAPTADAVKGLLRAREAYSSDAPLLVALTNSETYTSEAIRLAKAEGVTLIFRSALHQWPYNLAKLRPSHAE